MKRNIVAAIVALILCVGCSSNSPSANHGPNPPQDIYSGAWEFVLSPPTAQSPAPPNLYVEVNLTQTGGSVSGSGYAFAPLTQSTPESLQELGSATVTGTVSKTEATLQLQFGGATYTTTASVAQSAGTLAGSFVLTQGNAISIYATETTGTLTGAGTSMIFADVGGVLPLGTVTMTVKEQSNFSVSATGMGVNLTGTATGNAFTLNGTVYNGSKSWLVFYDVAGVAGTAGALWMFDNSSDQAFGYLTPQ